MKWEVIRKIVHDTSGAYAVVDESDRPAVTITVSGGAGSYHHKVLVEIVEADQMPKLPPPASPVP